jgi:hypothetical protein
MISSGDRSVDGVAACGIGGGLAATATSVLSGGAMLFVDLYRRLVGPAAHLPGRRRDGDICELGEYE